MKELAKMFDAVALDTGAVERAQVQMAALLYLLSLERSPEAAPKLTRMALDHLEQLAADPNISPVIRSTCAGIARQWRTSVAIERDTTWH